MGLFGNKKKKILVSDGDILSRQSLMTLLLEQGYEVLEAQDGGGAVKTADKELPDLILLDNSMPLLAGATAVAILRTNPKTQAIPIIVLSSNNLVSDVEQCLSQGARDYIVKPFDKAHLLAKIQRLLE
ncbi:MAG: response regulator [Elusimicrobiota bacterium]